MVSPTMARRVKRVSTRFGASITFRGFLSLSRIDHPSSKKIKLKKGARGLFDPIGIEASDGSAIGLWGEPAARFRNPSASLSISSLWCVLPLVLRRSWCDIS